MKNESKNPAAVALGKLGGGRASEAQRKAAKENGKKGGRPRNKVRAMDVTTQSRKA